MRRIADFYDRSWLALMHGRGNASERPVFVVGMPRSGTTLTEQILAAHPSVCGVGELSSWQDATGRLAASVRDVEETGRVLRELADGYLRLLDGRAASAARVVDKLPNNFLCLGLIHAALPNARIIHMRRHPADTCLSIFFQDFNHSLPYGCDLGDLARYHDSYRDLMAHWRRVLPDGSVLEVPYEGLTEDPETWSRRMVEFIGLPWDPACLEFHRRGRTILTFSQWQVRQRLHRASVERWRHYEAHIGPLLALTARAATER